MFHQRPPPVTVTYRLVHRTFLLSCCRLAFISFLAHDIGVSFVSGQYYQPTSYGVESEAFTTTGSTISPSEFPAYFQPGGVNWQSLDVSVQNACNGPPAPSDGMELPENEFCLSSTIPFEFEYYGTWINWLQVDIQGGTIQFEPSNNVSVFSYVSYTSLVTVPQPGVGVFHFPKNYDRGFFYFGFNTEKLWNLTTSQVSYATIVSNQTNPTSILLIRGNLSSYFNASIPAGTNTLMEFELQFHAATGEIVMHIIQLVRASAFDLWHPLTIGTIFPSPGSDQASMYFNNDFSTLPSSQPFSSTVHWLPFNQSFNCSQSTSCHTCLQTLKSSCVWCPTSGTCLPVPSGDQQQLYLNLSQAQNYCPMAPTDDRNNQVLFQQNECPFSSYLTSYDCISAGYTWCTGEANCAINSLNDKSSWGWPSSSSTYADLDWNSFVGRCISPFDEDGCSQVTCNQLYGVSNMGCGEIPFSVPALSTIACICDPGYIQVDYSTVSTFDPTVLKCNQCNLTQDYYEASPGVCDKCPTISPGAIIGLSLGAIVLTFLLVKLNSHPLIQRLLVPIQNSIVYFQVISLLILIDFHWPLAIRRGFSWLGLLGLNFFHLTTVQCWLTEDQKLLFTLCAPIVIGSLLLISHIIINLYKRIQRFLISSIEESEMHRVIHKRRELFRRAFISFLLLFYNFLVYTCLNGYFSFTLFDAFVLHDSSQKRRFFLVLFGTIFYVGGIPFLFWFLIFPRSEVNYPSCCPNQCRKQIAQTIAVQPLVSRYRPGYSQYWEIIFVCLWKILFNAIIVFISSRDTQIILIAVLLISMILSYSYFRPYISGINNRQQQWLMSGSLIILFGGVLFYVGSPGDTTGKQILVVISYLIVIVTMFLMIGMMIYVMVTIVKEYRAAKAISLGDESPGNGMDDYDEDEITAAVNNDANVFSHQPTTTAEVESTGYRLMSSSSASASSSSSLFDRPSSMHEPLQRHLVIPLPPSLPVSEMSSLSSSASIRDNPRNGTSFE